MSPRRSNPFSAPDRQFFNCCWLCPLHSPGVGQNTRSLTGLHIPTHVNLEHATGPVKMTPPCICFLLLNHKLKLLQKKKALTGASRQNYKSISSVIDKQCVSMKLGCLNQGTQTFSLMQVVYFCCSLILKTFHVLCGLQPYGLRATDSSALDNFLQAICEPANMGIPWA